MSGNDNSYFIEVDREHTPILSLSKVNNIFIGYIIIK